MVSLEAKATFLKEIESNAKLFAFYNFLQENNITTPVNELIEIDQIYYSILQAITEKDKSRFVEAYGRISKRIVDKNSNAPFIYDDSLLFAIIVGVAYFKQNDRWVREIVGIRSNNPTTTSFQSILDGNFFNKAILPEIVIPFLFLSNQISGKEIILDEGFVKVSNSYKVFETNNNFQILLLVKTYDLIIESKKSFGGDLQRLAKFENSFLKRMGYINWFVYNFILVCLLVLTYTFTRSRPEMKGFVEDFGLFIGIIGWSLANFLKRAKQATKRALMSLLGYQTVR